MKFFSRFVRPEVILNLVSFGVLANGLIILLDSLREQLFVHSDVPRIAAVITSVPVLEGITLIYLATLLRRRKRTAWLVVLPVYSFILLTGILRGFIFADHHLAALGPIRNLLLPLIVVYGLIRYRSLFNVKSDVRSFTLALRTTALVLLVAFAYGVAGFILMDHHDFHEQITIWEAAHRTIDQFDLTTSGELHTYSRRAALFVNSLSVISIGAVAYSFLAIFQPLKARLTDETHNRDEIETLLEKHPASSEDFFKLWPHDKQYFINRTHTAAIAYHVQNGVALCVGDPAGKQADFPNLLNEFAELCKVNDWLAAFIHTEDQFTKVYTKKGYSVQKIGEEAILHLSAYQENVRGSKYFRQIRNKFEKKGYTTELLQPPHNEALLQRLHNVSDDWLTLPGRAERGFMMGYFSTDYLQQCPIMILRDAAGTIQAFINQIPSYDKKEANYDLLRHTKQSMTNSNDYLLMQFVDHVTEAGFERLNLGLCPLSGLDNNDQENTTIDNLLKFVYANGDRFYSFSGLRRFKSKYEPEWTSRYIAYRGGIRGFTRTVNALNKTLNRSAKHHK